MIVGVVFALFASLAYGVSSVLQAYGARRSHAAAAARGDVRLETRTGAPTLRATLLAMLTVYFIVGTVLDVVGFAGSAVSARLAPLFLSQTIVSANLIVTALLGTVVLGIRLHPRDWLAIGVVIAALCALGFSAEENPRESEGGAFHWALLVITAVVLVVSVILVRYLGSRAAIAAGLSAGALFGAVAISVRVLDGVSPFDLVVLLSDPAAYALALAGAGGFYLHTVALQLGSVNGATAALVVGETVVPGVIGVLMLGDRTLPGLGWLAVLGFVAAVIGAVAVAWSGAVEAASQSETGVQLGATLS
ncbi:hypothetical protein [Williamsia sp. CHRR-6]|uniref:hypothetical protein n=1 Tax=Williamsia sp. CHRR-6 TaxID=2835871 RepID=UPI001BD9EEE6|nr:hypothetical protein [Williamsia sp. CHRR-6]MBT0567617.1 hypothetical protein [Williamsia sp. CHRR-6]